MCSQFITKKIVEIRLSKAFRMLIDCAEWSEYMRNKKESF
jgi:hypothetical protein